MPEDAFTRVPFYGNVYEKTIDSGAKALQLKTQRTGKPATELEIQGVERAAHRRRVAPAAERGGRARVAHST